MSLNGVFLSGWDYNRLLAVDPLTPAQSGLPAEVLWNGCAQFWLFENVYCTKEAYEGELLAAETLDWTTGHIFRDLQSRGFLRVFDMQQLPQESPLQHKSFVATHEDLRQRYGESDIRSLLHAGDDLALEEIKLELFSPVVHHLRCVPNISANSIRQWVSRDERSASMHSTQARALARIVEPLVKKTAIRSGTRLCNSPGTGVSKEAILAQKEIEQTVQRPMITDLLSGRLLLKDYMEELLRRTPEVYRPINKQLLDDYKSSIEKLERLRDLAKQHLWKISTTNGSHGLAMSQSSQASLDILSETHFCAHISTRILNG